MLTEVQMSNKRLKRALRRKDTRKVGVFNSNASYTGKYTEQWNSMPVEFFQSHLPRAHNQPNLYARVAAFFRRKTI